MSLVSDLMDSNTKARLRDAAYELELSIPRGSTKEDVARLIADRVYDRGDVARRGTQVESIPGGAAVFVDGELYWSRGYGENRHEMGLHRDGESYVLNAALRGDMTLFAGAGEAVAFVGHVYWTRV